MKYIPVPNDQYTDKMAKRDKRVINKAMKEAMSNSTQNDCNCIMSGYAQTTNYCPVHKNSTQNDWTKRFDEKFTVRTVGVNSSAVKQYFDAVKEFTRKELADARKEVISKVEKMIDLKYPQNVFTEYTNDPNVMTMSRGVAESTHIRRLSPSEVEHTKFLDDVLATLKEEQI